MLAVLPRPLRWLVGTRWGIVVLGVVAGVYTAVGATWLIALGSAASSVALVLVVREVVVRLGPLPSLRAALPTDRQAAWLAGLLVLGYLVLGFSMRRESLPPVLGGQLTVWVMYAVVVGLYLVALRRARTLPVALALPQEPPVRRPLVMLGVTFTVAATLAALVRVSFVAAFAGRRYGHVRGLVRGHRPGHPPASLSPGRALPRRATTRPATAAWRDTNWPLDSGAGGGIRGSP